LITMVVVMRTMGANGGREKDGGRMAKEKHTQRREEEWDLMYLQNCPCYKLSMVSVLCQKICV